MGQMTGIKIYYRTLTMAESCNTRAVSYHFGCGFSGRTTWTCKCLRPNIFLSGCESGILRPNFITSRNVSSVAHFWSVWLDYFPSTIRSISAIAISRPAMSRCEEYIIFAGGGLEAVICWKICLYEPLINETLYNGDFGKSLVDSLECTRLAEVCNKVVDETQRILSLSGFAIGGRIYVCTGNSSGDAKILILSEKSQTCINNAISQSSTKPSTLNNPQREAFEALEIPDEEDKILSKKRKKKEMMKLCLKSLRLEKTQAENSSEHIGKHRENLISNFDLEEALTLRAGPDKPILTVKTLYIEQGIVVALGSSDGNLRLFLLHLEENKLQYSLKFESKIHKMGINDVDMRLVNHNVVICCGGDDESIGVVVLESTDLSTAMAQKLFERSCASSIRGIKIVNDSVFSVGWNQRLRQFRLSPIDSQHIQEMSLVEVNKVSVNCADVSGVDAFEQGSAEDTAAVLVVVGAGVEVFYYGHTKDNEQLAKKENGIKEL